MDRTPAVDAVQPPPDAARGHTILYFPPSARCAGSRGRGTSSCLRPGPGAAQVPPSPTNHDTPPPPTAHGLRTVSGEGKTLYSHDRVGCSIGISSATMRPGNAHSMRMLRPVLRDLHMQAHNGGEGGGGEGGAGEGMGASAYGSPAPAVAYSALLRIPAHRMMSGSVYRFAARAPAHLEETPSYKKVIFYQRSKVRGGYTANM